MDELKRRMMKKRTVQDRFRKRNEYFLPGTRYRCAVCGAMKGWRRFKQSPANRLVCDRCMSRESI